MLFKNRMNSFMLACILISLVMTVGCKAESPESATLQEPATAEQAASDATPKQSNSYTRDDLGFSLNPGQLMVDEDVDDREVLTLTHLSGDKATVTIKEPDELIENPEEWLKRPEAFEGYKKYKDDIKTINGYPARVVEYDFSAGGRNFRVIDLTAYKDAYFYNLLVMMDPAYMDDTRKEFDKVVDSFALSEKAIDMANLELWRKEVPADFPFDVLPFYEVDRIYSVFGKSMAESGYLTVGYDVKEGQDMDAVIAFYEDILKGTPGYTKYTQMDDTIMKGTLKGYEAEAKVGDAVKKDRVLVYLTLRKPK